MIYLLFWLFFGLSGREIMADYNAQRNYDHQEQHDFASFMRGLLLSYIMGPFTFVFFYYMTRGDK